MIVVKISFSPSGDLGRETSNGLAYLILDSTYYDRLIPFEKKNQHYKNTGHDLHAIPNVETWIADKIPLTWIEKVIRTSIAQKLTDEQIQRYQIMELAHRNLKWGSD